MAINTSTNNVRIINTTVSGTVTNSKFSDIKSPALVVNTSEGGIFYADGNGGTSLKQLAALPNHTHSGYATTAQLADYLPKTGGTVNGNVTVNGVITTNNTPVISSTGNTSILFNPAGALHWFGVNTAGNLYFTNNGYTASYNILHSGNYSDYVLSKTGGTVNGNITAPKFIGALEGNADKAYILSKSFAENINYGLGSSSGSHLKLIRYTSANGAVDDGFPAPWTSGLSVITTYTGWQMLTYGGNGNENPYFRSLIDNGTWTKWRQLAFIDNDTLSPASGTMTVNGNVTATKFFGALQGNADTATTATSASSATNATTATKAGNASILLYPENSNEINFGGTGTSMDIYFGYRQKDGRNIPTQFIFGGSTGTANIKAAKFIGDVSGNVTGNVSGSAGSVAWSNVTGKPEIYTKSSVGTLDWTTSKGKLINVDAVAHWNGAYQNANSNLQYCDRGRFGTIVTKNVGDYATADHTHSGLVGDIITITKSLNVTTDWQDTGISYTDIPDTGTYIIQLLADLSGTAGQWYERYSGIMSWYAGGTNSTDADEIFLHKAGHATNEKSLFLRTCRGVGGVLSLQIASTNDFGEEKNLTFRFRKMI